MRPRHKARPGRAFLRLRVFTREHIAAHNRGMTTDYSITLQDGAGRTCSLAIVGASIDEMVAEGYDRGEAREEVEGNAFQNAIEAGAIGADAWLVIA